MFVQRKCFREYVATCVLINKIATVSSIRLSFELNYEQFECR